VVRRAPQEFLLALIAGRTSSYACKVMLARLPPTAGPHTAGPLTACLTPAVDIDQPFKLPLVVSQVFLLPPSADRALRRFSGPAGAIRMLPTQGPHVARLTAAVEFDWPVAHLLAYRPAHEEQHTQHSSRGRALRDVQSHVVSAATERACVCVSPFVRAYHRAPPMGAYRTCTHACACV
jgi:hypothetical protein